ncbi:MAG: T9SS type A sorting domain-containing protein [Bacteroidia bacterium]|nr:T9SS type A sorting domain-containing protein [Bacteroidia bacterium]
MRNILQILAIGLAFLFGSMIHANAQNVLFKRYIQVTDTIIDGGVKVAVSHDDAEQENDEMDSLEDDDIDAGWEGDPSDFNVLTCGLRFRDIFIPKGAVIDSAFIVISSHEGKTSTDVAELTIFGEKSGNAPTYTLDSLIDQRDLTNDSVVWTVNEEWGLWTTHRTVDVKSLVQEIIDLPDWQTGNPVNFIIKGKNQGVSTVENAREFESFENIADPGDGGDGQNHPERVPELFIYYTAPGNVEVTIAFTDSIVDGGEKFATSSDDAEQENDEMDSLTDDDIDAGWEGDPTDFNILTAGMIFRNIPLEPGTMIDSAFIYVSSHEAKTATDVAELTIKVEDSDSAATFTIDSLIDARPTMNDSIAWTVAEPWGLWTEHRTPDLKTLVQAMVDRPGWKKGNAISFIILGKNQGVSTVENAREWESYENIADPEDGGDGQNHPERVPRLRIYFNAATGVEKVDVFYNTLKVYPNPSANQDLTVEMPSAKPATLRLFHLNGQLVAEKETSFGKETILSTAKLNNGTYYLQVAQDGKYYTQKVVINN